MNDRSPLFGPDDRPLRPQDKDPLSFDIQNAVKIEVNSAMDNTRDGLKRDFEDLRKGSWIRFGVTIGIGTVVAILGYFNLLDMAKSWTHDFVRDNMDKPMLEKAASDVMDSRVAPYVSNAVLQATRRVDLLNQQLSELEHAGLELKDELEFNVLVNKAQMYDRDAYEKLVALSTGTNSAAAYSGKIVWDIQRRLEYDRFSSTTMTPKEQVEDKEYSGPFTPEEIISVIQMGNLEGAANYARDHNLKLLVPEFVDAAVLSKNLWEANRVTFAISELTGQRFYPWTMSQLTNWWNTNKSMYTNWPSAAYEAARNAFSGGKYAEALTNYQAVLAIDKDADITRMRAIACALECSNLQLATNLFLQFSDANGRWRKLAQIKITASTGDVSMATSMLVDLSTNYPTFKNFDRGSHVWRQIDWKMYDTLIAGTGTTSIVATGKK